MSAPILHLLGLARRAGKLEMGEEPVGAVARAKQAKVILLASDVSPNTSRRAATFGQIGNVLQISLPYTKEEVGLVLGRNSVAMIALTDAGFAGAIGDKLVALDAEKYGPAGAQLRAKADRTLARQKEKRQHEKNLQRGKGKPWAVPPAVEKEKQAKKKKAVQRDENEKTRNKSPNFKGKKYSYSSQGKNGTEQRDTRNRYSKYPNKNSTRREQGGKGTGKPHSFENKPRQESKEYSPNSHGKRPSTGKRMVIKSRTQGSPSAKT